jgi:hypothetical protein
MYAAIDIHKRVYQAAVIDEAGQLDRAALRRGACRAGRVDRESALAGALRGDRSDERVALGCSRARHGWASRSGSSTPCRREGCKAAVAAPKPTVWTRAGSRCCWLAISLRLRGLHPRRSSVCVTSRACATRCATTAAPWPDWGPRPPIPHGKKGFRRVAFRATRCGTGYRRVKCKWPGGALTPPARHERGDHLIAAMRKPTQARPNGYPGSTIQDAILPGRPTRPPGRAQPRRNPRLRFLLPRSPRIRPSKPDPDPPVEVEP